ncbi:hypothetical protein MMC19_000913, partial [Ptychographa xylographoides]|nr:hypothetical protein [Ptychographa xylographoides]
TTSLGNAYGVCVILVTFITTNMVAIVALISWRLNPFLVFVVWLVFALLDGLYLSASLIKVPQGAWFTLALAVVLSSIFILWRFGKEQQWKAEASDRFQPSHLVKTADDGHLQLTPVFGGGQLVDIKGFAVFFDKAGEMTPTVFIQFLSKFVAMPSVSVFFHLRPLSTPSVPDDRRYTVSRTSIPNCYRLVIRHGYMDEVISNDLGLLVYEEVRKFIIRAEPSHAPHGKLTMTPTAAAGEKDSSENSSTNEVSESAFAAQVKLRALEKAYETQVLYIMGKEQMRISEGTRFGRWIVLNVFLWLRENTRSKMSKLKISMDQLVEVGFVKEI